MTASTQLTPDTVCVAIDIAKRYHDVLIRWPDGREKVLKMPNTRAGHDDLIRFLQQQKAPVLAVLEPTADFHRPLAYRLAHAGYRCISPHPWRALGFERPCIPRGTSMIEKMRVF